MSSPLSGRPHPAPARARSTRPFRAVRRRAARLGLAAALVGASVAAAQPTPTTGPVVAQPAPIALDSVHALVARRSPRVRAAAALARAAAARVPEASRPPDPQLQLGFMNYGLPDVRPDPALGMTQLQLVQMVPLPGKRSAAGRAARARAEAAGARAEDVKWEARAAAATAFYERYELEGRVAIALATRRLLEDAAEAASAMYRVGSGRQADVLRARVAIARVDEEIVRMRAMGEAAAARLAAAADGAHDAIRGAPVLPVFPDTVPSREALESLALRSRPMLDAGAAEVRAALADDALARRERWPDLEVGVQYGQRRMDTGTDRMGSLMIGAAIPVFARSRQLPMREAAAAMRAMAAAELESMRADTRGRVGAAHAELESARRLAALYRTTVLPQAEAATASALASYRSGGADFMTVVGTRMSVNEYRQALLALEAAEGRAWAELEMLVGRPLLSSAGAAAAPRATGGPR